jgi:hypothetical protein
MGHLSAEKMKGARVSEYARALGKGITGKQWAEWAKGTRGIGQMTLTKSR